MYPALRLYILEIFTQTNAVVVWWAKSCKEDKTVNNQCHFQYAVDKNIAKVWHMQNHKTNAPYPRCGEGIDRKVD